jgi:phosphoribosyl 1,2-cyclic phosphate phosphodiesterase
MFTVNGINIVIDCGPDFRYQMLRAGVKDVAAIVFTHEHRDHTAGLDDVRPFNWIKHQDVKIFAEKRVIEALKNDFSYVFNPNGYAGAPVLNINEISNDVFYIDNVKIIPIRAYHKDLPVLGFRIGNITYITDANYISEKEKKKIVGSKYIVINALRKEKHVAHFNLQEAIHFIQEFDPEKGYITHIGHQMGFHTYEELRLPPNVRFAYDGLVLEDDKY